MKYLFATALSFILVSGVPASAQVLYNNGVAKGGGGAFGMTTNPGAGFGGADVSQADPGYGRSVNAPIFADDFTIGGFQSLISSLTVYSHISNYPNTVSPFIATTIDIYSGRPGDVGSSIIATSSNQTSSIFTNLYRVSSGSTATTLTDATRPVFATTVSFTNLTLDAGTYWFSFRQTSSTGAVVNVYGATNTVNGTVRTVAGNALGYNANTGVWDALLILPIPAPTGTNPNAPGIQMDLPFRVNGTAIEPPPAPAAPEPGTLLLALLPAAGTLAARYRRRS